jgi:hypothetical protein
MTPFEPRARRPVPGFVYRRQTLVKDKKFMIMKLLTEKQKYINIFCIKEKLRFQREYLVTRTYTLWHSNSLTLSMMNNFLQFPRFRNII